MSTEPVQTASWDPFFGAFIVTATLPPLPEGKHKLTVFLKTYIDSTAKPPTLSGQATVYFAVSDVKPPKITLNILNGTLFNQTDIPLNFNIDESTSSIAYCLDNGTQTTITTNTTLTVSEGNHTIIIYANDTAGKMGQSEVAYFTVQTPVWLRTGDIIVFVVIVMAGIATLYAVFIDLKASRRTVSNHKQSTCCSKTGTFCSLNRIKRHLHYQGSGVNT